MSEHPASDPVLHPVDIALAFLCGTLLTCMVFLNGTMARATTALFSSLAAHVTGTVAAGAVLLIATLARPARARAQLPAPLWAYLGGLSGAVTVMLTSTTVNSPLALSGTLALGLAGQAGFALIADRFGLFGLPRRRPTLAEGGALALILGGSVLVIFAA